MRWPRGRYNGQRITGFRISFEVNVDWMWWKPRISWNFGEPHFIWLIFYVRLYAKYSLRERDARRQEPKQ